MIFLAKILQVIVKIWSREDTLEEVKYNFYEKRSIIKLSDCSPCTVSSRQVARDLKKIHKKFGKINTQVGTQFYLKYSLFFVLN